MVWFGFLLVLFGFTSREMELFSILGLYYSECGKHSGSNIEVIVSGLWNFW